MCTSKVNIPALNLLVFKHLSKYLHESKLIVSRPPSASASYEDLSLGETMEMHEVPSELPQLPQLPKRTLSDDQPRKGAPPARAGSVRRLVRQSSVMDTQRDSDGSIKMTYWFWTWCCIYLGTKHSLIIGLFRIVTLFTFANQNILRKECALLWLIPVQNIQRLLWYTKSRLKVPCKINLWCCSTKK